MRFLYLSCSDIMDSPGGEFNSYTKVSIYYVMADVKHF